MNYALADFMFTKAHLSKRRIDELFQIIPALCVQRADADVDDQLSIFASHTALEEAIDAIEAGDAPWQCFVVTYQSQRPPRNVPRWMDQEFEIWTRDPLVVACHHIANREFYDQWDYAPYHEFVPHPDGTHERVRKYKDFMSAKWSWSQCDEIAKDPHLHGAMFVPIICGSDKTAVSVATEQIHYGHGLLNSRN